jgi:hypothetical protein
MVDIPAEFRHNGYILREEIVMKLYIYTQDYENYAWCDGVLLTGPEAYWKAKGGSDFFVENFVGDDFDAFQMVQDIRHKIEVNNDGFISDIIGWAIVPDDFETTFVKSQREYDGEVTYPTPIITEDSDVPLFI